MKNGLRKNIITFLFMAGALTTLEGAYVSKPTTPTITHSPALQQLLNQLKSHVTTRNYDMIQKFLMNQGPQKAIFFAGPSQEAPNLASLISGYYDDFTKQSQNSKTNSVTIGSQIGQKTYLSLMTLKTAMNEVTEILSPLITAYNVQVNAAITAFSTWADAKRSSPPQNSDLSNLLKLLVTINDSKVFILYSHVIMPYQALMDLTDKAQHEFNLSWIKNLSGIK